MNNELEGLWSKQDHMEDKIKDTEDGILETTQVEKQR